MYKEKLLRNITVKATAAISAYVPDDLIWVWEDESIDNLYILTSAKNAAEGREAVDKHNKLRDEIVGSDLYKALNEATK